jgi:MFS family permease
MEKTQSYPTTPRARWFQGERVPLSTSATFRFATLGLLAMLVAAGAPSPLYGLYASEFGFSTSVLTVVFAVYALALLGTMLIVGSLSDYVGRKPVLFAALTLEIVSFALFLLASGVPGLIIARLVQGVSTGAAIGTLGAILLDTEGPRAGRGTVVNSIVSQVGFVFGAVGAGVLAEYAPAPLELVFWVLIACFAALFAVALLMPETGELRLGARRSLRPEVMVPKRVRGAFYAAVPLFVATWAVSGLYVSLGGSIVNGVFGYSNLFVSGLIVAAMLAPGAVASHLMRSARLRTAIRFGSAMLIAGLATTLVGLALGSGPLGFSVFVFGTVVAGIGFGSAYVGAFRSTMAEVPAATRAATLTAILGVSYLSFSIPALIAGALTTHVGIRSTAIGYGAAVIAITVGALAVQRLRSRPTTDRDEDDQAGEAPRLTTALGRAG